MVYAVQEINNDTTVLPNVTLGFAIVDDCNKDTTAMTRALQFIQKNTFKGDELGKYI